MRHAFLPVSGPHQEFGAERPRLPAALLPLLQLLQLAPAPALELALQLVLALAQQLQLVLALQLALLTPSPASQQDAAAAYLE